MLRRIPFYSNRHREQLRQAGRQITIRDSSVIVTSIYRGIVELRRHIQVNGAPFVGLKSEMDASIVVVGTVSS